MVVDADLKLFKPASIPSSDTGASGGACTANEVTNVLNELFPALVSDEAGGADKTWHYKAYFKNTNVSDDLTSAVVFIENALDSLSGAAKIKAVSDSASDDTTVQLLIIGYDSGGEALSELVVMNGLTQITSVNSFLEVFCVLVVTIAGASTPAIGTISISSYVALPSPTTTLLGIIPPGICSATSIYDIALSGVLDDTASVASRLTVPEEGVTPVDLTFSRPNALADGLAVANGGTLSHESAQGIWIKITGPAGIISVPGVEIALRISGTA